VSVDTNTDREERLAAAQKIIGYLFDTFGTGTHDVDISIFQCEHEVVGWGFVSEEGIVEIATQALDIDPTPTDDGFSRVTIPVGILKALTRSLIEDES
jgi:hypothetical protein